MDQARVLYDEHGRWTEVELYEETGLIDKRSVERDAAGRVLSIRSVVDDVTRTVTYGEDGPCVLELCIGDDCSDELLWRYDDAGRLIDRLITKGWQGVVGRLSLTYDERGFPDRVSGDRGFAYVVECNEAGRVVRMGTGRSSVHRFLYASDGRLLVSESTSLIKDRFVTRRSWYADDGALTMRERGVLPKGQGWDPPEGIWKTGGLEDASTELYAGADVLVARIRTDKEGNVRTSTFTYEHDARGNWTLRIEVGESTRTVRRRIKYHK